MKQFQKTVLIPLLIAILLFVTGYKVFTCSDLARMHHVQLETYAFVQERVARYDAVSYTHLTLPTTSRV